MAECKCGNPSGVVLVKPGHHMCGTLDGARCQDCRGVVKPTRASAKRVPRFEYEAWLRRHGELTSASFSRDLTRGERCELRHLARLIDWWEDGQHGDALDERERELRKVEALSPEVERLVRWAEKAAAL